MATYMPPVQRSICLKVGQAYGSTNIAEQTTFPEYKPVARWPWLFPWEQTNI